MEFLNIELADKSMRFSVYWGFSLVAVMITSALLYGSTAALYSLGLSKDVWTGLGRGLIWTIPTFLGYAVIGELNTESLVPQSLLTVFVAASMEEVVFRGFLFGQLFHKANWGFIPAVAIGAILFGIGHLGQGDFPSQKLGIFTITMIGAIWFSWIYVEWESNLWVAIGLHFFMNLSWSLFSIDDTALGGWGSNLFRITTIGLSIVFTIMYRQHKGFFRINRNNLFHN